MYYFLNGTVSSYFSYYQCDHHDINTSHICPSGQRCSRPLPSLLWGPPGPDSHTVPGSRLRYTFKRVVFHPSSLREPSLRFCLQNRWIIWGLAGLFWLQPVCRMRLQFPQGGFSVSGYNQGQFGWDNPMVNDVPRGSHAYL